MGVDADKLLSDAAELEGLAADHEYDQLQEPLLLTLDTSKHASEDVAIPSAMQPFSQINVQRTGSDRVEDLRGKGYQTGICDCFAEPGGVGLCCYGTWCASCLFGQNVAALGPINWSGAQAEPSIIPCWAACLTFGVLQFLPPLFDKHAGIAIGPYLLQRLYRRRIREHFNIEGHSDCCNCGPNDSGPCSGDDCADCCSSFWCLPCALCQDSREIAIRGKGTAPTLPAVAMIAPSHQSMTHLGEANKMTRGEAALEI